MTCKPTEMLRRCIKLPVQRQVSGRFMGGAQRRALTLFWILNAGNQTLRCFSCLALGKLPPKALPASLRPQSARCVSSWHDAAASRSCVQLPAFGDLLPRCVSASAYSVLVNICCLGSLSVSIPPPCQPLSTFLAGATLCGWLLMPVIGSTEALHRLRAQVLADMSNGRLKASTNRVRTR